MQKPNSSPTPFFPVKNIFMKKVPYAIISGERKGYKLQ
jgi:hypothetical protein